MEVKCLNRDRGAATRNSIWFCGSPLRYMIRFTKRSWTPETLSIVARTLPKQAIRVGDGRTVYSFEGVYGTVCLGEEMVT